MDAVRPLAGLDLGERRLVPTLRAGWPSRPA
jgi:hypothetical protein